MNCFAKGHLARQCTAALMCTKRNTPHHSVLHLEPKTSSSLSKRTASPPPEEPSSDTCNHTSMTDTPKTVLLMMCQLTVMGPEGLETKARALIDPGSSTSFVSEHLVQHLHLPQKSSAIRIVGIGGISCNSSRGTTRFHITKIGKGGAVLDMVHVATILPKITATCLPVL